eukprot:365910-Chlamydomonas_euryale.AAC.33
MPRRRERRPLAMRLPLPRCRHGRRRCAALRLARAFAQTAEAAGSAAVFCRRVAATRTCVV